MNYKAMTYEDALEYSELEKNIWYRALSDIEWCAAMGIEPNPWDNPDYFEVPAFLRGDK